MTDTKKRNGDWYCRNCGYLPAERVTFYETCVTCHEPVTWKSAPMAGTNKLDSLTIPERIWLQTGTQENCGKPARPVMEDDITWCAEAIYEHDTEYVRADIHRAAADELERARARIAELEAEIQSAHESALRVVIRRRIGYDKTPCSECSGLGIKMYGSTATWRGGIGGQMITDDVCDRCWGSGNAQRPWPSWRETLRMRDIAKGLLDYIDKETCVHEETHRAGFIWTVCDGCRRKWADDEGGFRPHVDSPVVAAAREALSAQPGEK